MLRPYFIIVCVLAKHISFSSAADEVIRRNTNYGVIEGFVREFPSSVIIEKYFGIPYAAPPVGEGRLRPPSPHETWSDPLDASSFKSLCPQISTINGEVIGEEDCLYLNIYVPRKNYTSSEKPLAVMVWIHGGGYMRGSADFYDGELAWFGDVIVVTMNYRLGALGFLSAGDGKSTSNIGFLDQITALQWINENIENFDGDKNRITIIGESSGAASTQLHALSASAHTNLDKPQLFHRIISESGSAFSDFGFVTNPSQNARFLFERLACPTYSTTLAVECIREKTAAEIMVASIGLSFGPVVDGEIFPATPQDLSNDQDIISRLRGKYDYIVGLNSFDALVYYSLLDNVTDADNFNDFIEQFHAKDFRDPSKIADAVFFNYVDWTEPLPTNADDWKWLAINATRDFDILSPTVNFSNLASDEDGFNSDVYLYIFTPRPSEAIANTKWAYSPDEQFDWVTGARHAEELAYVFGVPMSTTGSTLAEVEVSLQMTSFWGNFARTGNPNLGSNQSATFWPKYNKVDEKYMVFGTDDPTSNNVTRINNYLESDKTTFWINELPLYGEGEGLDDSYEFPQGNVTLLEDAVVETTGGLVKGLHLQREKYLMDRFFAIPYGTPPLGDLRFTRPTAHPGWEGTLNCDDRSSAKQWLKICPQRNVRGNSRVGQEDCLVLNVWVPGGVEAAKGRKLPVMAWIYGGGFQIGTSIGFTFFYDMERLAAQGNIIGVTLNYRLTSLGFMSTGDENSPGNYGLLDQALALQWIQDNIANFGGDPEKVTIFGESAGGVAVSLHMLSPISKPLFLRGISESGQAPSDWSFGKNPLSQAERLAQRLGCPTDNTKLLVGCLRSVPLPYLVSNSTGIGWGAVVDNYFLTDDPTTILHLSADKDYMMGYNNMEGHGQMSGLFPRLNFSPDRPNSDMDRDDVRRAARLASANSNHVMEALAFKFIDWEEPESTYLWPRLAITDLGTDPFVSIGAYINANVRAETNSTGRSYRYIFAELSRVRRFPYWVGSNHLREMFYTFGHPFEADRFNDTDRKLSLAMMTYWTNFAWSGDPSYPNQADIPIEWPEYTLDSKYTIWLNTSMFQDPNLYLLSNYRGDVLHMWREIQYKMRYLPLTTCPTKLLTADDKKSIEELKKVTSAIEIPEVRATSCPNQQLIRSTTSGCVEGYEQDWNGHAIERYLGVPYAEPPVGSLRFSNPANKSSWSETLPVKDFSKICPQGISFDDTRMDEDCLYLSIYVPSQNSSSVTSLSVMVWLHGGGHQSNDGMGSYQGDILAALGNVIVVTVNYRLGTLGFLSTDDSAARGNFGLLDQQFAIKWVKHNIANFGGDPNQITIAGQSTGGQDVLLQTLSPMNDELGIKGAILESPAILPYDDMLQLQSTLSLAEEASCDTTNGNEEIVNCLRQLSVSDLMAAQQRAGVAFTPTVDEIFMPVHPREAAVESRVIQYKYLLGANDGDGSIGWVTIRNVNNEAGYTEFINNRFLDTYGWRTTSISEQYGHYEDLQFFNDDQKIQKSLLQLFADEMFIFPTHKYALDYSEFGADVYFYYFTYPHSMGPLPSWAGAPHSAEVDFVFGRVIDDDTEEETVKELSRNMIGYWTNFIKTGDPNLNDAGVTLPEWTEFKKLATNRNYMRLDIGNLTYAANNLRPTWDAFWNDYMPRQSVYCEDNTVQVTTTLPPPITNPTEPEVVTSLGHIRGRRMINEHFDVHQFLGIPYAKPPLEELRFAKTEKPTEWATTLDATNPKLPCLQFNDKNNIIGSEDCLYLDVYMPSGIIGTNSHSMPIMVWIHGDADAKPGKAGGSFWSGGGSPGTRENAIDPSYLVSFGNVVIIRPNYRLGVMGFLSTEDDVMKGNYGLWDLKTVIEWTFDNAHNFGADPNKLTLFGQGSGAAAAEILGSLPSTSSYVKRVISQSGSAFSPWAFCDHSNSCGQTTIDVAASVGCGNVDLSEDILQCLQTTDAVNIMNAVPLIQIDGSSDHDFNLWGMWRMRKDDDLIPVVDLQQLFANSSDFDYLAGTTSHEFYYYLKAAYPNISIVQQNDGVLGTAVSDTHRFLYGNSFDVWSQETYATLLHSYTPWQDPNNEELLQQSAVEYYSDFMFKVSSSKAIAEIARTTSKKVYQYLLTRNLKMETSWIGGCHGDDVIYEFGIPITSPDIYSDEDRKFSQAIISRWTNFAWSGDPNTAYSTTKWRHYLPDSTNYIELDLGRSLRRQKNLNAEKNALWNDVVPMFPQDSPSLPTASATTESMNPPTEKPPTEAPPPENCEELVVPPIGEGLGLNLTPVEADTAIYVMFSVCLSLGTILILLVLVWFIKSRRAVEKSKAKVPENGGKVNGAYAHSGTKVSDNEKVVSSL
uniref:uncharacterized protein LOC120344729 n=1 Tax=Styela clava TaxID=7725 RepID=UPI00193A0C45|nr:uncharacterized protein LOC120344729 [Styela clava]